MRSASFSPSDSFKMYKQLWATVMLRCYKARVSWPCANVPSVLHLTSVQSHILSGLDWPPFFSPLLYNQLHFPHWLRTDSICLKVTVCISVKKSLSFHSNSIRNRTCLILNTRDLETKQYKPYPTPSFNFLWIKGAECCHFQCDVTNLRERVSWVLWTYHNDHCLWIYFVIALKPLQSFSSKLNL